MAKRRSFTGPTNAKVALEALRGDRPIQEIAAKRHGHPDRVGQWKRQAIDGLADVLSHSETPGLIIHVSDRTLGRLGVVRPADDLNINRFGAIS